MPCGGLRWGKQKLLRCVKVNADGRRISAVKRKLPSLYYSCYVTAAADDGGGGPGGGSHKAKGDVYDELITVKTEMGGAGRSDDDHMYKKREMGWLFTPPQTPDKRLRVVDGGGDDDYRIGIAAVREKVILDLRTAADKMKDAILRSESFKDDAGESQAPSPSTAVEATGEGMQPWNLRTRPAVFRLAARKSGGAGVSNGVAAGAESIGPGRGNGGATGGESGGSGGRTGGVAGGGRSSGGHQKNLKVDLIKLNVSSFTTRPLRVATEIAPTLRNGAAVAAAASRRSEKKERTKFSVPLTRKEIEEDFIAMVSHRPHRRPKKRAKYIQKTLDTLFPGLWLTEITADIYKVPEAQ